MTAAAAAERERIRGVLTAPIHFELDRSEITPDARDALDAKRAVLATYSSIVLRIEGHADDRGSDEYNVALGQRRAAAARQFFANRDIPMSRIEIVSYGEERPVCGEDTDPCWARNRRDEFAIVKGW